MSVDAIDKAPKERRGGARKGAGRPPDIHTKFSPVAAERLRHRIQSEKIIHRLNKSAVSGKPLHPSVVAAAKILLAKVMPDLAQTENKTEVTTSYVARVPAKKPDMKAWASDVAPALEPDKPSDPNKVN